MAAPRGKATRSRRQRRYTSFIFKHAATVAALVIDKGSYYMKDGAEKHLQKMGVG